MFVPTLSALKYHMLRSEFVLKTVFRFTNSAPIDPSQYGWRMNGESGISIVWDGEETIKAVVASKGCGCKGAKCDGSTAGCRNCYRMCKPCNSIDVNHRMKVTTMPLMTNKRLLNHYHLYPVMQIP